jgi:uncharacterized protein
MITATPFLAATAAAELEDWGPLDEALPISGGEPMQTSGTTLWTGEGDQEAGVWECTAGPSRWSLENNEFVYILSGRMTVTPDGGAPAEVQQQERELGFYAHLGGQPALNAYSALFR